MAAYQNAECENAVSQHHARNHFVSRIPQIGRQSRTKRASANDDICALLRWPAPLMAQLELGIRPAQPLFERYRWNSITRQLEISDRYVLAVEPVMNKLIPAAFLILAVLALPALSHASANIHSRAGAQKEKPTPLSGSHASCKKYFPLIGALISVPCSR